MSEHLNEGLRRAHERFRRDHDHLREQLMATLPERVAGPVSIGRLRRGWRWLGATKMRRSVFGSTAVAASLVLAALVLTPGKASHLYAMSDVINTLRTADVIHAKGWTWQPLIVPPGQERTRCPVETWIDRRNARERRKSSSYSTDGKSVNVSLTESVNDGKFVMEVNHAEETVEYTRLSQFRRQLQLHQSLDQMLEQWFGEREKLGFTNTGRVELGGKEFDLWRGELPVDEGPIRVRVEQWVAPGTKEIAALKYWVQSPASPGEWTLVLDIPTIERNVPIPPGTFDTTAPRDYTLKNTKETAIVPELQLGGGVGLGSVHITQHIEFAMADGSVLVGWRSWDDKDKGSQKKLFAPLEFGGTVPRLPIEVNALKPNRQGAAGTLIGYHLVHTEKDGRFCEWSLYVPNEPGLNRPEAMGYDVVHRFNQRVPGSAKLNVTNCVRIRDKADFDALVLGAMAELSDEARPPSGLTYDRIMELSRQKKASPATATAPGQ
jgi:hypothetical protein